MLDDANYAVLLEYLGESSNSLCKEAHRAITALMKERDSLRSARPVEYLIPSSVKEIKTLVQETVNFLDENGAVLIVEQRPLKPLSMNNYETVVEIRKKFVRTEE